VFLPSSRSELNEGLPGPARSKCRSTAHMRCSAPVTRGVVSLYNPTTIPRTFEYTGLAAGPHVLQIRPSSGRATMDAFIVSAATSSSPTADFIASPLTGTLLLTVTFTNQSTLAEAITSYLWDFGDGTTSPITNPVHIYTAAGVYTVSLTASGPGGSDTLTRTNYITVEPNLTTRVIQYTYDPLYRLVEADYSSGENFAYAYDAVGNRTAYTRTITSTIATVYTYDAANRLATQNGESVFAWDDNGNLLSDGSAVYEFNQANRLISATVGTTTTQYAYNGNGARLRLIINGLPTTYTLDLAAPLVQVLVQQDSGGSTRYLYGVTRVGEQQSAGWVYHLSDALGSVRQLVDGGAQVVLARGYMPYGEVLWSQGASDSKYGFTGEAFDASVGLVFLRARYMLPGLGMFLSRDPWEGNIRRPGSMNGWVYGLGNPVKYTDPSGLVPFPVPPPVPPSQRRSIMESFRNEVASGDGTHFESARYPMNEEMEFVNWMVDSRRLKDSTSENWWSKVNGYVTMSRLSALDVNKFIHLVYPCFKYSDLAWSWGGPFGGYGEAQDALAFVNGMGLEPGVKEWTYLVWFLDYAKTSPYETNIYNGYLSHSIFWAAHNAAIREGVDRAASVRRRETYEEQELTNYVLYNVLLPGDECASMGRCFDLNRWFLWVGTGAYPWHYPASSEDIQWIRTVFGVVYQRWGVPAPDPNMQEAERYRIVQPIQ